MRVRKLTSADRDWIAVGDQQIFVNDLIDEAGAPDARMTVGFARVGKGESMDISFPYDEVLVITSGSYAVRTEDGEVLTAGPGEVIYLPGGSSNASWANEDTTMVYVANPPDVYAEHVRAAG
ncbi:DUF861 domain-containing protein [Kribbella turkmenica]|uniref:DUF861 domain-containing protein n=1 Tax=Kribbella turkmenica TaxID=2530375 RepID=A0A4R4XGF4_9ACTN|nr:DUF861 domain-containing protein [Kribbella turkmenica]TDD29830.1 DUF861 domain-containing protein [Kribbella turkmenica]